MPISTLMTAVRRCSGRWQQVANGIHCLNETIFQSHPAHGTYSHVCKCSAAWNQAHSQKRHNSSMASGKHVLAKRYQGTDRNVWVEFIKLAKETNSLNLGQGFPDFMPPKYLQDALLAIAQSNNPAFYQYTRAFGHPRLVQALSDVFSPILNHKIDPMTEVLVSNGAYGILHDCACGLLDPGDEAIIIEPFFDCYAPFTSITGATPVYVPLRKTNKGDSSKDWKLDPEELEGKFSSKTKVLYLNNPNNPLGKVFDREELQMLADLCVKYDVVVLADEVYEWLVYKPNEWTKFASLPGMWDRTVSIGSAGKTFSVTGWKLGWALGPPHLMHCLRTVSQNSLYNCNTPLQEAVAVGFELEASRLSEPECYFNSLPLELVPKRDRMAAMLSEVGLRPIIPEGGYFMMADFSQLDIDPEDGTSDPKDYKMARWLMRNKKLATIPPTAFYSEKNKHLGENMVRLCFSKQDSTLDEAEELFANWKATL